MNFMLSRNQQRHLCREKLARRGGQVAILSAAGMVAVCGFLAVAVDYGILTNDANRMQRASDAAALAAVQELKKTSTESYNWAMARYVGATVARANGISNATADNIQISNDGTQVTVTCNVNRTLMFARVLGRQSQSITRRAVAAVMSPTSINTTGPGRAAPIGITRDTYDAYKSDFLTAQSTGAPVFREITLIRQNKETFGMDDMALFDLRDNNAKSPAQFEDQLTGADNETTYLNDGSSCNAKPLTCENTLNAAQPATSNKLLSGLGTLFNRATGAPWNDGSDSGPDSGIEGTAALAAQKALINPSNPRVLSLIVTNGTTVPNNGTWNTPVLGYAPVYVHSIEERSEGHGRNEQTVYVLKVAFLPPVTAPEGTDGVPGSGGNLSGVRVSKLIE